MCGRVGEIRCGGEEGVWRGFGVDGGTIAKIYKKFEIFEFKVVPIHSVFNIIAPNIYNI